MRSLFLTVLCLAPNAAAEPTYWQDVRPIMRKHCTVCHNPRNLDEIELSGGLTLDTYESLTKAKKPLLHVGKSKESPLVQVVVNPDEEFRMPLGVDPLDPAKIEVLRRWIDTGAKEGTKPDSAETTVNLPTRRRKLDVVLTTKATPPANLFGKGKPSPLQLRLPVGPLSPVTAVAFSPDGRLLATGSYGIVSVWDLQKAQPALLLTQVLGSVNDLRFSPDGKMLAVAGGQPSARGDLRLFSIPDGKLLASLSGHRDVVASVAFHPKGTHLASASFDRTMRLWNLSTFKMEREYVGHSDFVYALDFAPDGSWIASASKDRSVKVVETMTGKSKRTFSGIASDILAVAVHPGGKSVLSSGLDARVYWWDVETGKRTKSQSGHRTAVNELTFSGDGKLLASAGSDSTVKLWDGTSGALKTTLTQPSIVYSVASSADGTRIAAGCYDGMVRLWDVKTSRQLATLLTLPPLRGRSAMAHPNAGGLHTGSSGTGVGESLAYGFADGRQRTGDADVGQRRATRKGASW